MCDKCNRHAYEELKWWEEYALDILLLSMLVIVVAGAAFFFWGMR